MKRPYRSIIMIFLVCLTGLLVTPLLAVSSTGEVEVTIVSVSSTCNRVTVRFDTRNADEIDDTFILNWSILSDGVPVAKGNFETTRWSGERNVVLTVGVTLSGSYDIEFEGNDDGAGDSRTFVAGACTAETASSSEPVQLPPCEVEDGRLDESCGTFVVTYDQALEDGCYISIYSKYGRADGRTVLLFQSTPAEIAAAQAQGGNAVIERTDVVNLTETTLYWLPETGEFQVNAGPNAEGKVYVLNFTGCPATNIYNTNSFQKPQ